MDVSSTKRNKPILLRCSYVTYYGELYLSLIVLRLRRNARNRPYQVSNNNGEMPETDPTKVSNNNNSGPKLQEMRHELTEFHGGYAQNPEKQKSTPQNKSP